MYAACVELPASNHGEVRSGGKISREDRVGDAFLFQSTCETVRYHFYTARRLVIDGPLDQRPDVGEDLDKCILIIYMHVICLHYV